MTAIRDAYNLINNKVPGVDRYFMKQVTGKIYNNKTDLLISPVVNSLDILYGSNQPICEKQQIEVQVFIGLLAQNSNMETIKNTIVSFFIGEKWFVTYGPDYGIDPETGENTLTINFTRYEERNFK